MDKEASKELDITQKKSLISFGYHKMVQFP